jgi:hypothetical protein
VSRESPTYSADIAAQLTVAGVPNPNAPLAGGFDVLQISARGSGPEARINAARNEGR